MRAGFAVLSLSLAVSAVPLNAQRPAGPELRGIPASVTSPRPDGTLRGIPGSVTDPRAAFGFRGSVSFGNRRPIEPFHHRRPVPVVVVPYYAYPYAYDYSAYEEPQPAVQTVQPQVIVIKDETVHSDDSSRYGEHSFEEREPAREETVQPKAAPAPQPQEAGPPTTLVYRDGHKTELRNYAIVGTDLLDLTKSPVIRRIPLASLDLNATRQENEENGVDFYLP
jgi:hypothetical protein